MIKVLFLTREYPPFEVGGVARHTFNLVRHLNRLDVSCKVLSFGDPSHSNDYVMFIKPFSSIISRSNCPLYMDARIPVDIMRLTKVANRLIDNENFDIVHVEEPYVGAFVRHERKVVMVQDTSYGEIKSMFRNPSSFPSLKRSLFFASLGPCLELMCMASSRIVIVPLPQVEEELSRIYGVSKRRIRVIENGVEIPGSIEQRDKVKAKRELELSGNLFIFTAARHVERKRLDTLVEAVKLLHRERTRDFGVVIAGDGPLRQYMISLVRKYGLEDVISFPGWIHWEKLEIYYRAADIFVLTSGYETGPMSLLEAMSFGDAAISSRIEGFPKLIREGIDGLLFQAGDYRALSACMKRLLDDTSLRARLSASARSFAERFGWENIAKRTLNLYKEIL